MSEDDTPKQQPEDLSAFGEKIKKAREAEENRQVWKRGFDKAPQSALGLAFRVSVELVSALAVGCAIGWALDEWLDTRPFMMVAFLFVGGAAGILNVYRMATGLPVPMKYEGKTEDSAVNKADRNPNEGKD